MEENTGKVWVAGDANLAATSLMTVSGTGSSLFVINLCASMAPAPNVGKSLPGLDSYRLYQVARREDGRTRYRLRLGFFASEAEAESVLNSVRDAYPTAFTACLCDEDRKFARGFVTEPATRAPIPAPPKMSVVESKATTKAAAAPTAVAKAAQPAPRAAAAPLAPDEIELSWDPPPLQAPSAVPSAAPTQVVAKQAAASMPAPAKQTIEAPSKLLASIELTLETEPTSAPKKEPVASSSDEPFRVGKGVEIPISSLTLQSEAAPADSAAKPALKPTATASSAAAKPTAEVSKMKAAQATAPAAIKAAVAPPIRKTDGPPPDLDTTQTIRALTSDELKDESQEKWFAIQLAASDQPVNLDAMPRLDIFEAYRLYSVASAGSGKITHSLRIGFFREEVSAEAVSGYLKTFFSSPSVVRISIAEQARFKDPPVTKPAPKEAKVLDLSHARDRAPKTIPTVTMEVEGPKFDPSATGSFKTSATGVHKAMSTGAHKALGATGAHKALDATGTHKAFKAASKSATPATKRSPPLSKSSATGKHKALQPKPSLSQQLLDEAREVELSASGIRKLPKSDSLLSKMFGKRTKG